MSHVAGTISCVKIPLIAATLVLQLMVMTLPSPALAQQNSGIPEIEHVALNIDSARRAIDVGLFVRGKYSDAKNANGDPKNIIDAMKARGTYGRLRSELNGLGFSSPEIWSKTTISTAVAVSFMKNGKGQEMMAQLVKMQKDKNMSAQMKKQMMATVQAIMPPKENIAVVEKLLADPAYSKKAKELFGR